MQALSKRRYCFLSHSECIGIDTATHCHVKVLELRKPGSEVPKSILKPGNFKAKFYVTWHTAFNSRLKETEHFPIGIAGVFFFFNPFFSVQD